MNSQTTSARRITPADHFNTRFSFIELFHSYNHFSVRVSLFEIAHRFRGLIQSDGRNSYLVWPLISCAPDQHPDERQFSRLKNHCELADDARVGGQKEGGTGADHVAATGDYREDAHEARNKT